MASHNDLGKEGEELAVRWLEEQNYSVVQRNWYYGKLEIDIIATKGKFLHFIEVKSRNFSRFGYPEYGVTRKKFKFLQRAADEYLFRNPGYAWIQYDILSITFHSNGDRDYFFIEDVYF